MEIIFQRQFKKQYKKLPTKIQRQFNARLRILEENTADPQLNVHALKGDHFPMLSMNVTGDYRALFVKEKGAITFLKIGTHSELYS